MGMVVVGAVGAVVVCVCSVPVCVCVCEYAGVQTTSALMHTLHGAPSPSPGRHMPLEQCQPLGHPMGDLTSFGGTLAVFVFRLSMCVWCCVEWCGAQMLSLHRVAGTCCLSCVSRGVDPV